MEWLSKNIDSINHGKLNFILISCASQELIMNIVTVVKYKLKDGFEDEFIKAINDYDYSNSLSMRLVSIGNNEYLSIMEYDEIDKTGDDEIDGVNWLDTVEHMLEFYGESRTDACSGLVLAAHNQ